MRADLGKFLALEGREKRCLALAVVLLWRVRLGLWIIGYKGTREWVERRMAARPPISSPGLDVRTVTRMIAIGSRFVPHATCLVKALTAELLLWKEGHDSELHIGVSWKGISAFEAHAWLEVNGTAVVGGETASGFATIHRSKHHR